MKRKWIVGLVILGLFLIFGAIIGPIMSNVEKPKYDVISSSGDIEIRDYASVIIAEVSVKGDRKEAINAGFRLLADYIFGNNIPKKNIAMTAPVQQKKSSQIPMTAPVHQQSSGNDWLISFVMPREYSMETLPEPVNKLITLKEIPTQRYVVIRFSGINSDLNIAEHEKELIRYMQESNLSPISTLKYAFYNPPWTLPLMRRNEIMIEIKS